MGNTNEAIEISTCKVLRVNRTVTGSIFFDLEVNGITLYGLCISNGKYGEFISFPSYKGKDGKYYNHYYLKFSKEQSDIIINNVRKFE